MKISYGVTALRRNMVAGSVDGIGQYSQELLSRLKMSNDIDLYPLSFGCQTINDSNFEEIHLRNFSGLLARSILTNSSFAGENLLQMKGVDLYHATDHRIPKFSSIPIVATIHDAIPLSNPSWVSLKYKLIVNALFKRSIKWASRVITVSQYSKGQISFFFDINPENIDVIYNGIGSRWFEPLCDAEKSLIKLKYGINKSYIIFVGTIQPRKNLLRLINAYKNLPKDISANYDFLIIGREGWNCSEEMRIISSGSVPGVRWLGAVSDLDLCTLVKSASCFVFPSLAEGFGIPIVEAFAANIPVVCSGTTSLPEVAGQAALFIDPLDCESIRDGIISVLDSDSVSSELKASGSLQAKKFSWDIAAAQTLEVYRKSMSL